MGSARGRSRASKGNARSKKEPDAPKAEPTPVTQPVATSTWRTGAAHFRRYPALYAIAAAWLLMISLVPSVARRGSAGPADTGGGTAAAASDTTGSPVTGGGASKSGASAGNGGGGVAAISGSTGTRPVAAVKVGTGVTRSGDRCAPGVRQVPWSAYAPPCVAAFSGFNGGATYNGVDATTIKIVDRVTVDAGGPAAAENDRLNKATGGTTSTESYNYAQTYISWFNKKYETYGRKVVLSKYNGQGNSIDEAQSKGQNAACADATDIAKTQHAFSDVLWGFTEESGPFADCSARQHMFLPLAAPYFPETYFKRWDPYIWDNTMQCERISLDLAEYIGKRLNNRKAKWAGQADYKAQNRKFGLYVPNNDAYQSCVNLFAAKLKSQYGGDITSRYNYALDVSQFPSEALRASVKFQAAGVTTVILACDNLSPIFLSQAAKQQNWHPEWLLIGVAGTDQDGAAPQYEQSEVNGHLFGMSQLGNHAKLESQSGEAAHAWREATGGQAMPQGASTIYFNLVQIYRLLQAAGPVLTPHNIAVGARSLPPVGGAVGAAGTWSFKQDHTATVDAREIYWVCSANCNSTSGASGHYLETYGGRRFGSRQWPVGEPPIYPGH